MKTIKAIIIDDERPARKELMFLLKPFPEIEIAGESENIEQAVDLINTEKPDVVFLDIQLAGENGFDLLDKVSITFKLIFVTAYDEYAIRAFEVNATDYLLKPVDPLRLEQSINRIFGTPLAPLSKVKTFEYSDSIYVKLSCNTAKFIKLNSVATITSIGNYTRLHVKDGRNYTVLKTLKQWEEELPKKHFIRIHRSSIVNIEYINRMEKYSGIYYRIHLQGIDEPMEVSRSCASKMRKMSKLN
jgi:two-component system, LytTR family, response regulator